MAWLIAPGGLLIRLGNGGPGDQGADKDEHTRSTVAQAWNAFGEVESLGAPAAGFAATIGAKDAFADGLWIAPVLLLIDKAVGYQLMALGAMAALPFGVTIEFQGELVEAVEGVEKGAHCGIVIALALAGYGQEMFGESLLVRAMSHRCGNPTDRITVINIGWGATGNKKK